MKKSAAFLLLLLVCAFNAEGSGRKIVLSGKTDKFSAVEIIKANKRPVVDYAAKELALPRVRLLGDNPWHRLSFEFTAPKNTGKDGYVPAFGIWGCEAKGKAWFDEIRLEEL